MGQRPVINFIKNRQNGPWWPEETVFGLYSLGIGYSRGLIPVRTEIRGSVKVKFYEWKTD